MAIWKGLEIKAELENCIFANSLMSTTIQDSDKRKRSDGREQSTVYLFIYFYTTVYYAEHMGRL